MTLQNTFTLTGIANQSMPTKAVSVDVSASDYAPSSGQIEFGIYVGTGGNLVVIHQGDTSSVTYSNIPDGTWVPGIFKEIKTSGTTASNILALR